MKNILVINIVLLGIVELYAQEWELPTTPFYSTSAMPPSGSVLSQTAQTDATTTLISPSMMEEEKLTVQPNAALQRSRPGDWNDPYLDLDPPIGDVPWGMMLVCILIYMYVLHRKSRKIPADKP